MAHRGEQFKAILLLCESPSVGRSRMISFSEAESCANNFSDIENMTDSCCEN